ncbi:hypothetical protein [Flagellimonas zhangzhouensis]|uniref:DUF3098 domain-containing protein n=1 Tax=Flagellimonas zhangzhouensis TaxID=1073328 RepID=A0A1H2Q442_9FLAO|nr:hypothetical protein [Allomuricauda zhangzhouensis]SDQ47974.1 hypothetical protein SAMN05216294_1404 [Allomuricauda zhangzhouensis]SDW01927.1 hypothetical protein SAMN04487892_0055 [Allomuricauda zhangzhouensis]
MKKLNTSQKIVLVLGVVLVGISIFGKFNQWEYGSYYPIFYAGISMSWIAFLPSRKKCHNPFKKKQTQTSN